MTYSLYRAWVPGCLQMLGSVAGLLDTAQAHCAAEGWDPAKVINYRLAPDMLDFAYQVKSCVVHSQGAVEGVRQGTFSPDQAVSPQDFAGLRSMIANAAAFLDALEPDEFENFVGKDMEFRFKTTVLPFDADEFLLSFSQPNFYFHATTAYAILRHLGVRIGKMNYLGAMRMRPAP